MPAAVTPYGFIYIIENMVNGKVYVGQTVDIGRPVARWI